MVHLWKKLVIPVIIVWVVVILSFAWFGQRYINHITHVQNDFISQLLINNAEYFAQQMTEPYVNGNIYKVDEMVQEFQMQSKLTSIFLIDSIGNDILNPGDSVLIDVSLWKTNVLHGMTNLKANMIEAGAPILKEGNQIGALVIRKNLEPQNKDLINILIKPVIFLSIGLLLSFIIGSFIMRDISSDMHYVVYETKRIAKGNLGKKLSNPTFSDRTLMNSISEMIYGLQKKLVDINESTSKVETATKEIIEKVTNQRDYSTKFGNSVQEVNEISEVFWETIHRFEDDVKQVSNQSEAAVQRIVALGTKAQQIGAVTTAINDIAKRINLLSLNASIEAAQAGEHGQGFAVVAAEIRKLAESTKRSIEDIGELIEDIQSATNTTLLSTEQTVDSVKKIIDAVHNQVVLGKKVKAAIRQISDEIQEGIDITDNLETNSQQLQEATQSMRSGLEKFELY